MDNPETEMVTIVDSRNRVVDSAPRAMMRAQNLIHRACYIFVFSPTAELFIHKRTLTKDVYPGYWAVAVGGVVLSGEGYAESAARELREELGVEHADLRHRFDHFYEGPENRVWGGVFTCIHPGPFTLQKEEISEGRFLAVPAIPALNRVEPVTPDGLEILWRLRDAPKGEPGEHHISARP